MSKNKKSLVFSEIFPPRHGGSGRWMWEVYSRMNPEQFQFLAGEFNNAKKFDAKQKHKIKRIKFEYSDWSDWGLLSVKSWLFYAKLFINSFKIVKADQIDVIHCGRCIPEGVIARTLKFLCKTKYVVFIHGEDIGNAMTSRSFKWIVSKVLNKADLLVCNSKNSQNLLIEHWNVDAEKVIVEYPGVDTKKFKPASRSFEVRKKLGWGGRRVLLTVARLEEKKGHDRLVTALIDVKKEFPDILYAIVGDGTEKEKLVNKVKSLGLKEHVMFMSGLDDANMLQCYQQADLFVLPNRDIGRDIEGFGIVMIEAQACALPVIGGNSGGTPETILQGKSGLIVNADSPSELSSAVIKILKNDSTLKAFGSEGLKWSKNFDWQYLSSRLNMRFQEFNLY